jgi:hypothetical protein
MLHSAIRFGERGTTPVSAMRWIPTTKLAACLADLGFPAAKFEIEHDVDGKSAELVIHLTSEGPGPTIRNVQIVGNSANSEQAILNCAGINTGEPYSRERAAEWQYRLWQSGRFVNCKISADPSDTDKQGLTLHIEVTELKSAPLLDKPLSAKEAAFLKCRDRLAGFPARDEDLVLTMGPTPGGASATIMLSRHGTVMLVNAVNPNADGSPRLRYALLLTRDSIGSFSFEQRSKCLLSADLAAEAICQCGLVIEDNPEQSTRLSLNISLGIEGSSESPAKVMFGGAPVAFLGAADSDDKTSAIVDGKLRIDRENGDRIEIDAVTGALRLTTKANGQTPASCLDFQHGVYERMRRQIDAESATFANTFDARRPVTSAIAPLVEYDLWRSILGEAALNRHGIAAVKKLLANGALQPLEEAIVGLQTEGTAILPTPIASPRTDPSDWNNIVTVMLPTYMLTGSDAIFARDSWPWSLSRAYAFAFVRPKAGGEQMVSLVSSPKSGPLCCLSTAAMVSQMGGDAVEIAKLGRTRLTLDDFRNDYRPLLDQQGLLGRELFAIAGAVRAINADEVDALCGGLSPDVAKCFRDAAAQLRASPDEPLDKLIPQVLDHCWENGLKARIEAALDSLATEPKSPAKGIAAALPSTRQRNSQNTADAAQRAPPVIRTRGRRFARRIQRQRIRQASSIAKVLNARER